MEFLSCKRLWGSWWSEAEWEKMIVIHLSSCFILTTLQDVTGAHFSPKLWVETLIPQVRRPEKSLCPVRAVEEATSWANSPHKADSPLSGRRILHSALHLISGPHNNWPAFCRKESAGPGSQCHSMLFSVFLPLAEHRYSTGGPAPQNKGLLLPIGGH